MTPELLAALTAARAAKRPVAVATRLPDGAQMLLPDAAAEPELAQAAARVLDRDESDTVKLADGTRYFIHAYNPPHRLIVIGAVHIAQALVPMATQMGFAAVVVDPRRSFASAERFPGVELVAEWPDEAMETLAPDVRTAIVALTHDPKIDDPGLDRALRSPAFYIGALGGRKSHGARLRRLGRLGHDDAAMERIRGPVGLNIEAITAPEIALSIIAEIVAVRRNSPLGVRAAPEQVAA